MTKAYINYPKPHIRSYSDPSSAQIGKHKKVGQRLIKIDLSNLSTELNRFANRQHRFAASSALNDMWVELDLNDRQFEADILSFIQRQIGRRYTTLAPGKVEIELV